MDDLAEAIKDVLAIAGHADRRLLLEVLNDGTPGFSGMLDDRLTMLSTDPEMDLGALRLAPAAASVRLADLDRDQPRFHELQARVARNLADRLRTGESSPAIELAFMAVLERGANHAIAVYDSDALEGLLHEFADVPLTSARHVHLRRYLTALVPGLRDQYAEATDGLSRLLADPDLDGQIRGRALNSRASFFKEMGAYDRAMADYDASLTLWQDRGDVLGQGKVHLNRAILLRSLHRLDGAAALLDDALRCFDDVGHRVFAVSALNELGLVFREQGRLREALDIFEQVADARRADDAEDSQGRALVNKGEVLLLLGRLDEARAVTSEALGKLRTTVHAVDARLNLGLIHQVEGDLGAARSEFEAAVRLCAKIDRRDYLAEAHFRLAEVLRRLGEDRGAMTHYQAAVAVIEDARESHRDAGLRISILGRWQQVYEALVLLQFARGDAGAAFHWAERARARAFSESIGDRDAGAAAATTADVQAAMPSGATVLAYFTTGVREREVPLADVVARDERLRDNLLIPAHTLCFRVTGDTLEATDCGIDPNRFRGHGPQQSDPSRFLDRPVLDRLSRALIPRSVSDGDPCQVGIVPHGPLHEVPFAALGLADEGTWPPSGLPGLVFAPSAAVAVRPSRRARRPGSLNLVVGYGGGRLPHAEAEARFVNRIVGGEAWIGPEPKAERLGRVIPRLKLLHLACHGAFLPGKPLDSFVEIAPGERLTAREILNDWKGRMRGANLVVLSACETGLAHVLRGDEPMGLARSFLEAGARAVLVTQWPVADLSARLLMGRFYAGWIAGRRPPAQALRDAQIWLRSLRRDEALAHAEALAQAVSSPPADSPTLADPGSPAGAAGPPSRAMDALHRYLERSDADRPFADPRHWAGYVLVGILDTGARRTRDQTGDDEAGDTDGDAIRPGPPDPR